MSLPCFNTNHFLYRRKCWHFLANRGRPYFKAMPLARYHSYDFELEINECQMSWSSRSVVHGWLIFGRGDRDDISRNKNTFCWGFCCLISSSLKLRSRANISGSTSWCVADVSHKWPWNCLIIWLLQMKGRLKTVWTEAESRHWNCFIGPDCTSCVCVLLLGSTDRKA